MNKKLSYSETVIPIIKEAGKIALHYFRNTVAMKKEDSSLVTVADREIEIFLKSKLSRVYKGYSFVGEENPPVFNDGPYTWYIDPIDGTTSYAGGMPVWAISVGLMKNGKLVYGCLYLPYVNEIYEAETGKGAYLNGKKVTAKTISRAHSESVIFVPSSSHKEYNVDFTGKTRNLGSTSVHIVYSALGFAAASLQSCWVWDFAAALVILQELGGTAISLDGNTFDYTPYLKGNKETPSFLTGYKHLIDQIYPGINEKIK